MMLKRLGWLAARLQTARGSCSRHKPRLLLVFLILTALLSPNKPTKENEGATNIYTIYTINESFPHATYSSRHRLLLPQTVESCPRRAAGACCTANFGKQGHRGRALLPSTKNSLAPRMVPQLADHLEVQCFAV